MKLSHYFSIVAIAAIFASCGSQGATGPAGPTGATGATGASGTANIFTTEYTVTSWSQASSNLWIATYAESDITDDNADAVLGYWSTASSGWLALPVSSLVVTGDEMSFGYNVNSVTFSYYGNSNINPPSTSFPTIYFKVTVIPPALQHKYPGTNWQNASEVQNIPEVKAALNSADNR